MVPRNSFQLPRVSVVPKGFDSVPELPHTANIGFQGSVAHKGNHTTVGCMGKHRVAVMWGCEWDGSAGGGCLDRSVLGKSVYHLDALAAKGISLEISLSVGNKRKRNKMCSDAEVG